MHWYAPRLCAWGQSEKDLKSRMANLLGDITLLRGLFFEGLRKSSEEKVCLHVPPLDHAGAWRMARLGPYGSISRRRASALCQPWWRGEEGRVERFPRVACCTWMGRGMKGCCTSRTAPNASPRDPHRPLWYDGSRRSKRIPDRLSSTKITTAQPRSTWTQPPPSSTSPVIARDPASRLQRRGAPPSALCLLSRAGVAPGGAPPSPYLVACPAFRTATCSRRP